MNKKQAKKKVAEIRTLLLELLDDIQNTLDEIEPYEGREELTQSQEERQEWFENLQYEVESSLDNLAEYEE